MDKWMESYFFLEHLDKFFFYNRKLNGEQILFKKRWFKGNIKIEYGR